jgi:hypothetical protein
VAANYEASTALQRMALHLVARPPAAPPKGQDQATDVELMVDPRSGLVFEVRVYPGIRMRQTEVSVAWGVKAVKPEHVSLILG